MISRLWARRFPRPSRSDHFIQPERERAHGVLGAVTVVVCLSWLASAQGSDPCSGGGYNPTPVEVEVTAVPIVAESTTADYFVLYVSHEVDADTTVDIPVLVKRGEAGTTTLAENVAALPKERYRVEKFLIADPADVDGDCIDDITELDDLGNMNPVNAAAAIALSVGTVAIPDRDTFDKLSYSDKYIKFVMFGMDTADRPGVYFMNTENYPDHRQFMEVIGLDWEQDGLLNGELTFHPELMSPSGNLGVYYYEFQREPIFSLMSHSHTLLAASIPLLDDNLALYISNGYLQYSQAELPLFRESRIPLLFDEDIHADTSFLSLNPGEGYGLLRVMDPDERPHPRDIVIYEALPNELPRVAGIISTVPQTPLSHVNLRAIQDAIPNAFIRDALDQPDIDNLIGAHVHYTVDANGYSISAATRAEVDAHYASSRPAQRQTPQRDLSVRAITPLGEIGFEDWTAFGVKAANVAVLRTLGFPEGTVPDGFAVPFYFYDKFMTDSGLYDDIKDMLADSDFQTDFDTQESELKKLRKAIKDAETPGWMTTALTTMHATFPVGISLRYRSSTNNEDLPGFNGAGLYDSKTQHPDETDEDGIDKSLKQVYASLWNFRAFTERDFNRIDHLAAKMGVLVHPNYSDELANGVAVSFDPIRGLDGYYYVNTQVGEDLVTNPEAHSIPEELLLRRDQGTYAVLSTSNLVESGELLMSDAQLIQLRDHLTVIHERFAVLYNPTPGEPFAIEIEFKITSDNVLAIKQARPWVFEGVSSPPPPPPLPPPPRPPVPDAPTVKEASANSVTVSWTAPTTNDPPITSYDLQYRRGSIGEFTAGPQDVADTTATITGLRPDTAYEVQVRATSSQGDSWWSVARLVHTVRPPPVPIAPAVTGISANSVTVSWTAPTTNGPPIRSYDLRFRQGGEGEFTDGPRDVTETNATIEGLDPDTEYEVQVRSSSSAGDSHWSAPSTVRTSTPPPVPVSPEVTKTSSSSVTVGWTAPTHDGPPITSYDLRYRTGGEGAFTDGPQDGAEMTATIDGLDPDTEYEVQVRSSSTAGDSEWSAVGTVRTSKLILYDLFSLSLDLGSSEQDQHVTFLAVSPGRVVPIQVFGADIRNTRSLDLRVGYDSTQVVFAGFDLADALPSATALVKRDSTFVEIGIASLGGRATVDSGLVGMLRFRTTDALSETEIRFAGADLVRGEHPEAMTRSVSAVLQVVAPPSPDFDGTGMVAFADFVLFAGVFGSEQGDGKYASRYDLNADGGIGFEDFVIFAKSFGDTVNRPPVFALLLPVTRSVAENTPEGQPIGGPVTAADPDGDALTYSLWGADADHFDVDPSTGQILAKGTYGFEEKKGYAVILRASDGQGGRVSLVVNIAVTDTGE